MGILTTGTLRPEALATFAPRSSFIELVEYDGKSQTMDITFHSGSKVRYIQVYPNTFLSFKQSPVHSAFYARAIKGNMQSVKIIQNDIGARKSTSLNKVRQEKPLDAGLKERINRRERIAGTIERAYNAAAVQ